MAILYAVHNGPQGSGDGSSAANGMALQTALTALATAGDQVRICNTGTYTTGADLTLPISGTLASPCIVTGANSSGTVDGTRCTINKSTFRGFNSIVSFYVFRYIDWQSNTTNSRPGFNAGTSFTIEECSETASGTGGGLCATLNAAVIKSCTSTGGSGSTMVQINSGVFNNCVVSGGGNGFATTSTSRTSVGFINCVAYNCTNGFYLLSTTQAGTSITNCLAYECTRGLNFDNSAGANADSMTIVSNCTFADCTDGITSNETTRRAMIIENCIFANNTYGINNTTAFMGGPDAHVTRCAFYSNSSAHIASGSVPSDCETATDPDFVDDTNATLNLRDYTLNLTSTLRNKSFTGVGPNFLSYRDRGFTQTDPPAGGSVFINSRRNTLIGR